MRILDHSATINFVELLFKKRIIIVGFNLDWIDLTA